MRLNFVRLAQFATLLLFAGGCGLDQPAPGMRRGHAAKEGPFGPPANSRLLAPFAGAWAFNFDKTVAGLQAAGASAEELERLAEVYAVNPQFGRMHANITITGNEIVGKDGSEYRLFGMHEHDGKACGKAWHHEDRYDPGDMSKCYVRLKREENLLFLEVKMQEGLPDLSDPELQASSVPVEGGSAGTCDADSPAGEEWDSDWMTYVFSKN